MAPEVCPLCFTSIRLVQISYNEALYMCPNKSCVYPFGVPGVEFEIVERHFMELVKTMCKEEVKEEVEPREDNMLEELLKHDSCNKNFDLEEMEDIDQLFQQFQDNKSKNEEFDVDNFLSSLENIFSEQPTETNIDMKLDKT